MQKISATNIHKAFSKGHGHVHALGPMSFEVLPGEFICILGESGCGKSTLWRILAGLETPTSGDVHMGDEVITGPDFRRGVVFQNPALLPWLTVEQNVALGFRIRGQKVPKQLIQETIKLVGIEGFEKTKPNNLSGGMAQRAAIARALVSNPHVLLMDEPFGALDALTRLRMQTVLLDIWRKHRLTIIFITHDIDEAIALSSRVIVMTPRPGKISRIFEIPLPHPRSRASSEFLQLRGSIADELVQSLNESREPVSPLKYV